MDLTDNKAGYIPSTPYDGMDIRRHAAPGGNLGEFMAWNPSTGKKVWSVKENYMTMSGVLATAGDVVFYGTSDGWFRGVDARSGKVLWSQKVGSGIIGQPYNVSRSRPSPVHRNFVGDWRSGDRARGCRRSHAGRISGRGKSPISANLKDARQSVLRRQRDQPEVMGFLEWSNS
jgi:outer membrane protein assembly factor BamB